MTLDDPLRRPSAAAAPVRLDPAFADPEGVLALIRAGAPYRTQEAMHRHPGVTRTGGWFRNFWALGGKPLIEGAERVLHEPRLIAAARESFGAEVIRPLAMMTNLNLPMAGLPPHLDLPFFRGCMRREVPAWMLVPMGYSGLFDAWAVPVASAIVWFYDGEGGAFEYWPEGLDAPSRTERPPFSNRGLMADNERMWHRVGPLGPPARHVAADGVPYAATLALAEGEGWEVRDGDATLMRFAPGEVRLSVLWKAYAFADAEAERRFESGADDLTPARVTEIFLDDLRARGEAAEPPADPAADPGWKALLERVYAAPPLPETSDGA